jgi:hypothetical protein
MRASALFVAFVTLVSAGCAARRFDALMQSWNGHTTDDLFRTWGAPTYLYSDGKGGRIAVYVPAASIATSRTGATAASRQSEALLVFDPTITKAWPIYRIFFVDNTGRIVRSQWRGRWECCSS